MNLAHMVTPPSPEYYLPVPLSPIQRDINELILRLHSRRLQTLFEKEPAKYEGLSNTDLLLLFYTNTLLALNNPYLLVGHYIPRNMLLMNTKASLANISGKFWMLNRLIRLYEAQNGPTTPKTDVLVLANSSKELDFIESMIVGRLVNYKRYSGSKIFEPKSENEVMPFDLSVYNQGSTSQSASLIAAVSTKRSLNAKDDPYLITRLRRKHRKNMAKMEDSTCLTVHLVSVDQLKFQFFASGKLTNRVNFRYILSFNSLLNLDNHYLKVLRSGYVKNGHFEAFARPTPILFFLARGSIEHVTLCVHNWLVKHGHLDEDAGQRDYTDERPSKVTIQGNLDNLEVVAKLYALNRFEDSFPVDIDSLGSWLLGQTNSDDVLGKFATVSALSVPKESLSFDEFMAACVAGENPLSESVRLSLEKLGLQYHKLEVTQKLEDIENALKKNLDILHKFPYILEEFKEDSPANKKAELEIGDSQKPQETTDQTDADPQLKKRRIGDTEGDIVMEDSKVKEEAKTEENVEKEPELNVASLLSFSSDIPKSVFKALYKLSKEHELQRTLDLERYEPIADLSFNDYKKRVTQALQSRSETIAFVNQAFLDKLAQENLLGSYIQIRIEKNNYISRDIFNKQLELKKEILREEKYFERLTNEYRRLAQSEQLIREKIAFFRAYGVEIPDAELQDTSSLKDLLKQDSSELFEDMKKFMGSIENPCTMNEETQKKQDQAIAQLENEIEDIENESEQLSGVIEESRVAYQNSSAKLSAQVEEINKLDAQIKAIKDVLSKKDQLLELKRKALDFDLLGHSATFKNCSTANAEKYRDLDNQMRFMQVYMGSLRAVSEKNGANGAYLTKTMGNGKRRGRSH